jgi:hypothetical protein
MRPVALAGILASTTVLGGCAGSIAGVSLSSITSFAGIASTLFTGADLGEHAASIVTGKDCRFSEGLLREDRNVCEEPGSLATRNDFHGIFVERIDADGTVIYAAPKYMKAGVGAGEYENNPDAIWAQIKTQKAKEEGERQLARVNKAGQSIDVAALATGSLSSESLAFLPAATTEVADGDTASQTATAPRPVVNAAEPASRKEKAQAQEPAAVSLPLDQPAIEETALTVPLKAAKESGQGGPLITTSTAGTPVVSKLIKGEPVVILRLGPIFGGVAPSTDTASAQPTDVASEDGATVIAMPSASPSPTRSTVPSPLAVLDQARHAPPAAAAKVSSEPQMISLRPRTKPSAAEIAAGEEKAKEEARLAAEAAAERNAARLARKRAEQVVAEQPDVYRPPARDALTSSTSTYGEETPTPIDDPTPATAMTEPMATYVPSNEPTEPAPAATSGPAPLYPLAQP